jgi:lipopolysaccharide/colanic/teichoic acid biosynthesis glycosyltransferase
MFVCIGCRFPLHSGAIKARPLPEPIQMFKQIRQWLVACLLACTPLHAVATIVDFQDIASGSCAGLGLSADSHGYHFTGNPADPGLYNCVAGVIANNTSAALINANSLSVVVMTLVGGGPFSLVAFDAGSRNQSFYSPATGVRVDGVLQGGGTVQALFALNGFSFDHFLLPGTFTDLLQVTFTAIGGANAEFLIDNIVASQATDVTEPASIVLLCVGMLVIGALRTGMIRRPSQGAHTALDRGFDIVVASALLILALPVALLAALVIRIEGRGPVIFRQTRVGLNGEHFQMFKLRTMCSDAEVDGIARWAAERDPRITRIGRILRRTRIDELPQLVNVLRGEMSIVGPRPERPEFVHMLISEIPRYENRLAVKPGITGWAQVRYPYAASTAQAAQKLQYDLFYIGNRSLRLDLRILLETVAVVLLAEGAR